MIPEILPVKCYNGILRACRISIFLICTHKYQQTFLVPLPGRAQAIKELIKLYLLMISKLFTTALAGLPLFLSVHILYRVVHVRFQPSIKFHWRSRISHQEKQEEQDRGSINFPFTIKRGSSVCYWRFLLEVGPSEQPDIALREGFGLLASLLLMDMRSWDLTARLLL
jgi:hypothetical protein